MEPRPERSDDRRPPGGMHSLEYKRRLLQKIDCLIGVLETAIGKIDRSLQESPENRERLERIRTNLKNTLEICRRAKATLEERIRKDEARSAPEKKPARPKGAAMSFRTYVELSSIEEFKKFKKMKAITPEEIRSADLEELARKLFFSDPEDS